MFINSGTRAVFKSGEGGKVIWPTTFNSFLAGGLKSDSAHSVFFFTIHLLLSPSPWILSKQTRHKHLHFTNQRGLYVLCEAVSNPLNCFASRYPSHAFWCIYWRRQSLLHVIIWDNVEINTGGCTADLWLCLFVFFTTVAEHTVEISDIFTRLQQKPQFIGLVCHCLQSQMSYSC